MKTQILLATIATAALATVALSAQAGNGLLSPRAAGNQANIVPGIAVVQPAAATQSASPRAVGSQITTTAGAAAEVNPVTKCTRMTASPKAIQACAANPSGMAGCCGSAMADNTAR